MADPFVFHRPELAKRLADMTLGRDPLSEGSGLFLAAPRRTGKSTFLKEDLIPELTTRGALPVYVDLWADRARDPGEIILDAIRTAVINLDSGAMKLVRRSGLSKVGVGSWLSVDVEKIGKPGGATIGDAIAHLTQKSGRTVVLIVDEAQHATTSAAGANAMFALKSARDMLNIGKRSSGPNVRLALVFTGSHRDKLGSLIASKSQPFFGAAITAFPLLGRDFARSYTDYINARAAPAKPLDAVDVFDAFAIAGFRPELLQTAVKDYLVGNMGSDKEPLKSLPDHAVAAREKIWIEFDSLWSSLTDLQQAVLKRVVEQGDNYRPFDAAALEAYAEGTSQQKVTAAEVQSALDVLREKGLVIRLERGRYALDDDSMKDWFVDRFSQATAGLSGGP